MPYPIKNYCLLPTLTFGVLATFAKAGDWVVLSTRRVLLIAMRSTNNVLRIPQAGKAGLLQ